MGDDWLVDSKSVEIEIQSLFDFAEAMQKELEVNFLPSMEAGVKPMLHVQAPFGGGGLSEGKFFSGRHGETVQAVAALCGEAVRGLAALRFAADTIAKEYRNADALAQATQDDVYDAFYPLDSNNTLQGAWSQASKDGRAGESGSPVAAALTDPNSYFSVQGEGADPVPRTYQEDSVGDGAGQYVIQGDDENMHDPSLTPNREP
jgi:hypothetical protein